MRLVSAQPVRAGLIKKATGRGAKGSEGRRWMPRGPLKTVSPHQASANLWLSRKSCVAGGTDVSLSEQSDDGPRNQVLAQDQSSWTPAARQPRRPLGHLQKHLAEQIFLFLAKKKTWAQAVKLPGSGQLGERWVRPLVELPCVDGWGRGARCVSQRESGKDIYHGLHLHVQLTLLWPSLCFNSEEWVVGSEWPQFGCKCSANICQ